MSEVTQISKRKADHLKINLENDVQSGITTGLENYRFIHRALPDINLDQIDSSTTFFNKRLNAPLLISSMTGGVEQSGSINRTLAEAAQTTGIAMGVGSQRAALVSPQSASTFQIRQYAPDILLFANLGAIQLNYGFGLDECQRAVDMIEADALVLHLNSIQEALQPDGNTNFAGLIHKIEAVCRALKVPVIAKEVGWGFSEEDVTQLSNAGVAAIDVAGAGGTSWSQVEMYRSKNESQALIAAQFSDWGISTTQSIINVKHAAPHLPIIASGGLHSGIDIAKCLALGAEIGGLSTIFLKAAIESLETTIQTIKNLEREIRICMFGCGAENITSLRLSKLINNIDH